MGGEMSIARLVLDASLIVQIVLALLLGASIVSWAIIFRKRGVIRGARVEAERFEEQFWVGGSDLSALYREIDARAGVTGMASISRWAFASSRGCASRAASRPSRCSRGRGAR